VARLVVFSACFAVGLTQTFEPSHVFPASLLWKTTPIFAGTLVIGAGFSAAWLWVLGLLQSRYQRRNLATGLFDIGPERIMHLLGFAVLGYAASAVIRDARHAALSIEGLPNVLAGLGLLASTKVARTVLPASLARPRDEPPGFVRAWFGRPDVAPSAHARLSFIGRPALRSCIKVAALLVAPLVVFCTIAAAWTGISLNGNAFQLQIFLIVLGAFALGVLAAFLLILAVGLMVILLIGNLLLVCSRRTAGLRMLGRDAG
jgi:hypothetical protein